MGNIKNWKMFNEGLIKNVYNFYKLVKMLKGWKQKYQPSDYDKVIEDAYELIDSYGLEDGKKSPSFTLPNNQLDEQFIKKFLKKAGDHGYKVISEPSDKTGHTKFNFTR
jgi:hypothetical protein